MPTPKYRGVTNDPIDGRPMYWNVHPDGVPIRQGDSPSLITEDQLNQAGINLFFRSQVLRIPEDLDRYIEIWDWISNGIAVLKSEKEQPVPDHPGQWIVWISWVDLRGFIPARPDVPGLKGVI